MTSTNLPSIAVVGGCRGTNVAASLIRAAESAGCGVRAFDIADAFAGPRWLRSLAWRFLGRRPLQLERFGGRVVAECEAERIAQLVATGLAPLCDRHLLALDKLGIRKSVYVTDDPWNSVHRSTWFLKAVRHYDVVFTPRRSNVEDFVQLGCRVVRYLPFGYDPLIAHPPAPHELLAVEAPDVLFVGGGDADRIPLVTKLLAAQIDVGVFGAEWPKSGAWSAVFRGYADPPRLRSLTAAAKVNLILVRRANRDGHTMRSFEAAAIGGCLLVEWTAEHESIFGPNDECVAYFHKDAELPSVAKALLADEPRRRRLAQAVRRRIEANGHTYADRLKSMLETK